MYEVVLQLSDDIAADVQKRSDRSAEAQAILDAAQECNSSLVAHDSGVEDAELVSFFSVLLSDGDAAERLRERCSTLKGVKTAYVKSPGHPP